MTIRNVVCDIEKNSRPTTKYCILCCAFQAMYLNGSVQNLHGKNYVVGRFGNALLILEISVKTDLMVSKCTCIQASGFP